MDKVSESGLSNQKSVSTSKMTKKDDQMSQTTSATLYEEDVDKIGQIFDLDLFQRISSYPHIKETEQRLEKMKVEIKDKKKL